MRRPYAASTFSIPTTDRRTSSCRSSPRDARLIRARTGRSKDAPFDSDPAGRKQVAKGHSIARGVDDPDDIYLRTEYNSVEDAKAVGDRLLASGVLDRFTVKNGPTIVEVAEQETH